MMQNRKPASIKTGLQILVCIVLAFIFIGFAVFYTQQNKLLTGEYQDFVTKNNELNDMLKNIKSLSGNLGSYLHNGELKTRDEFWRMTSEIQGTLIKFKSEVAGNDECIYLYRTLSNMVDYSAEWAARLMETPQFYFEFYGPGWTMQNLYSHMSNHAERFLISYLSYSNMRYEERLLSLRKLGIKQYLAFSVMLCLFYALIYIYSKDILKTIHQILKKSLLLSQGEWETDDIKGSYYIELNNIINALNKMKNKIVSYTAEMQNKAVIEQQLAEEKLINARKDLELKDTMLIALQAQINPHFLFNTLNIIGRTALLENTKKTTELVEAIARIMRYTLEPINKKNPLQSEINALKAYIFIQETRFKDRMSINLNINTDDLDVFMPPMTLQPIVENAIIHGLADCISGGRIDIDICKHENQLFISIKDNGKGIEQCEIERLFKTEANIADKPKNKQPSIGLQNVIWKMKLFYGRDDLVSISSKPGKGTCVRFIIPIGLCNTENDLTQVI